MRRLAPFLALLLALSPLFGFGQTGKAELSKYDVVFRRSMTGDVYALDSAGQPKKLLERTDIAALSPDGQYIAYLKMGRPEVHLFSFHDMAVRMLANPPGGVTRGLFWMADSASIVYLGNQTSPGLHVVQVADGSHRVLPASYSLIGPAADGAHLLAINVTKLEKVALTGGHAQLVRDFGKAVWDAHELSNGSVLGALITHEDPPEATDDEPNCQGPTTVLTMLRHETSTAIPYPEGFDSVLDFDLAPDGEAVALTYGAAACDYPGDVARIYVVRLADLKMEAVSPADHLSVKVKWSPDGRTLAFSDYTAGNYSPLYQYEVASHKLTRLTDPGEDGPDEMLGWRQH